MGAQKLAGLGIEDGLDEAFGLAERDRLAVADEGNLPTLTAKPLALAAASVRPMLATCGWQ